MENQSNIARALSGDQHVFVIDVDKIISDYPRTGLGVDQVINYLQQGIFLNGDYYRLFDKKKMMLKLVENSK